MPCCLLINTWSSKLIWPSLQVYVYLVQPHGNTSSLWTNIVDFIFWLLHIRNLPTWYVLTPLRSPCTPFANYAHLFIDYDNTSSDYTDFFTDCADFSINYAHNFYDYVNTPDDQANNVVDSTNTLDISSLDFYIPNHTLL
jgi:hypothetical protein